MTDSTGSRPAAPRMLVMGVGSSGARAVSGMHGLNSGIDAVVVDTDTKVLEAIALPHIVHIGASVTHGLSAGGDVELGRQSIEKDSSGIRKQLRELDLLIIVGGLGGGTGSGAIPVIARIAREAGTLVLAMVATPFDFEGKKISRIAEDALKRLRPHADAIIRIPNERLIEKGEADIPVDQAFGRSHQVMMDGILAIRRMLAEQGVCGLDFACIHTMLRNCDGFCHFAGADGSGDQRADIVADALLKHRLLANGRLLGSAVGMIVGITGGRDLKLSEVELVMNRLQTAVPEEIWSNFGVIVDPAFDGRLSAIVLAAEQWKEALVDHAGRQGTLRFGGRSPAGQGELPLEMVGKGQFTYVDPTILNNQDLDVPTYIRRDIKLPR